MAVRTIRRSNRCQFHTPSPFVTRGDSLLSRPASAKLFTLGSRLPMRVRAPFADPAFLCPNKAAFPRSETDRREAATEQADRTLPAAPASPSTSLQGGCEAPSASLLFSRRARPSQQKLAR